MGNFNQGYNTHIRYNLHAVIIFVSLVAFLCPVALNAKPVSRFQVQEAVRGWLKRDTNPLQSPIGRQVRNIDTFRDEDGQPIYHIVYLEPSGFVIVPADDLVEPIIGFVTQGVYDPSLENPLGALVSQDIPSRIAAARNFQTRKNVDKGNGLPGREEKAFLKAQAKWTLLQTYADYTAGDTNGIGISDVRVAPLIKSKWSQTDACGNYCYNYHTPPPDPCGHYPCGCVATSMAQLMLFHTYPAEGIGVLPFEIYCDNNYPIVYTLGGDGAGGPYNWDLMEMEPDCNTEPDQREAIGALCYDAGVSVNMAYYSNGSWAYLHTTDVGQLGATEQLQDVFGYSNAVAGYSKDNPPDSISDGLNDMVNPNLDANHPVILGISGGSPGHAILGDGYGYDLSTLYHHLNMGWGGDCDAWYELPSVYTIDPCYPSYSSVSECVYNIFVSGSDEIISGRVTDTYNRPISGAVVTAEKTGGGTYQATTNSKGIYSFLNVPSASDYTISAVEPDYDFLDKNVTTGTSNNAEIISGNLWGVDFVGFSKFGCNFITIGMGDLSWFYPMNTMYEDSRTQVIYLAGEINTSGTITSLALDIETAPGETMNNWTIRMKHTGKSSYETASFEATGWTVVYQANEPNGPAGWRTFNFSTPFEYNGTDNLMIDFSYNNSTYSTDGYCRYSYHDDDRSAYASSENLDGDPLEWSGSSSPSVGGTGNVPNIKLVICNPWPGDFEPDYDVDGLDFAVLSAAWKSTEGQENWNPDCDIAKPPDGAIDELDLAVFAEYWLKGPN